MAWTVEYEASVNGHIGKTTVMIFTSDGATLHREKLDMDVANHRNRLAKAVAPLVHEDVAAVRKKLDATWLEFVEAARRQQAAPRDARPPSPNGARVEVLDAAPNVLSRPLRLVEGRAYAATWLHVQTVLTEAVNPKTNELETFDPPKVVTHAALAVVRDDGVVYSDDPLPLKGLLPLSALGLSVALNTQPPPGQTWSGAGVKRFLAGERPAPADVFRAVVGVVDRYMDFGRSLADQQTMCELVACYTVGTYFLDSMDVAGYLWPNGDRGTGKSNLLYVVTELAYLGLVILAGGSYASLRDLADYGATLAFDDAEGVMDVKRSDPDKRALLLAGNRRGATVTVKEPTGDHRWTTRHIHAFCHRLFSAIRLPDDVLGSRSIVVPLVRSCDPQRARRSPQDHKSWPCDRRRLLDDLWSCGLVHLPILKEYDAKAAALSGLAGRDLEPWRGILAVALWLETEHGAADLFGRMKGLATSYQTERHDLEARDPVRLAVLALQGLLNGQERLEFTTTQLAAEVNRLATAEELVAEGEPPFTNAKKLGWLLKRLRLWKGTRNAAGRHWQATAAEVDGLARAYAMSAAAEPADVFQV